MIGTLTFLNMPINKQFEILSVGQITKTPTARGGSYSSVEVAYKDLSNGGKVEGKKIVDFNSKEVFNGVQQLKQGDVISVTLDKDPKGYWQWTGFAPSEAGAASSNTVTQSRTGNVTASGTVGGKVAGSNYETPAERKLRRDFEEKKHRQIGRQGCLNAAINFTIGDDLNSDEIIALAKEFEAFVFAEPTPQEAIQNMKDDIPY